MKEVLVAVFILVAVGTFSILQNIGQASMTSKLRADAVSAGCAWYNPQTGKFEFKQ